MVERVEHSLVTREVVRSIRKWLTITNYTVLTTLPDDMAQHQDTVTQCDAVSVTQQHYKVGTIAHCARIGTHHRTLLGQTTQTDKLILFDTFNFKLSQFLQELWGDSFFLPCWKCKWILRLLYDRLWRHCRALVNLADVVPPRCSELTPEERLRDTCTKWYPLLVETTSKHPFTISFRKYLPQLLIPSIQIRREYTSIIWIEPSALASP